MWFPTGRYDWKFQFLTASSRTKYCNHKHCTLEYYISLCTGPNKNGVECYFSRFHLSIMLIAIYFPSFRSSSSSSFIDLHQLLTGNVKYRVTFSYFHESTLNIGPISLDNIFETLGRPTYVRTCLWELQCRRYPCN